jgi:hypothetical protein
MSKDSAEAVMGHSTDNDGAHHASSDALSDTSLVDRPLPLDDEGAPESANESRSSQARLAKLARNHTLIFLAAILSFAAADIWSTQSGLGVAQLLCLPLAALAGIIVATLVHEWFHYLGARFSGASIRIPSRQRLFVYHWDFGNNSPAQFVTMSIAGTMGGFLAVILLWTLVPVDTLGRAVLLSAAVASVIYSALLEWPVIQRTRLGGDPLAELSKIDKPLLTRSFFVASLSGIVLTIILMV